MLTAQQIESANLQLFPWLQQKGFLDLHIINLDVWRTTEYENRNFPEVHAATIAYLRHLLEQGVVKMRWCTIQLETNVDKIKKWQEESLKTSAVAGTLYTFSEHKFSSLKTYQQDLSTLEKEWNALPPEGMSTLEGAIYFSLPSTDWSTIP